MIAMAVILASLLGAGGNRAVQPGDTASADTVADPAAGRLFFNPTADVAPRGQRQLGAYAFIVPYVAGVPVERVEVTLAVPGYGILVAPESGVPFLLAGKVQILDRGPLKAAAGALYLGISDTDDDGTGVIQGIVTVEGEQAALTAALGRLWQANRAPSHSMVTVGGQVFLSPTLHLVAESHFFANIRGPFEKMLFVGPRFRNGRATVDLALWVSLEDSEDRIFPLPLLNVAWTW